MVKDALLLELDAAAGGQDEVFEGVAGFGNAVGVEEGDDVAEMWADTIGQWTFVKVDNLFIDLDNSVIYMYPKDDDVESRKKPQAGM